MIGPEICVSIRPQACPHNHSQPKPSTASKNPSPEGPAFGLSPEGMIYANAIGKIRNPDIEIPGPDRPYRDRYYVNGCRARAGRNKFKYQMSQ
jgi:hypothetical protein